MWVLKIQQLFFLSKPFYVKDCIFKPLFIGKLTTIWNSDAQALTFTQLENDKLILSIPKHPKEGKSMDYLVTTLLSLKHDHTKKNRHNKLCIFHCLSVTRSLWTSAACIGRKWNVLICNLTFYMKTEKNRERWTHTNKSGKVRQRNIQDCTQFSHNKSGLNHLPCYMPYIIAITFCSDQSMAATFKT